MSVALLAAMTGCGTPRTEAVPTTEGTTEGTTGQETASNGALTGAPAASSAAAEPSAAAPAPSGFVYIAPGTFLMGSPEGEAGRDPDRIGRGIEDQHEVTLTTGFYLQATEVTQGEWQALMGTNPSSFTSCGSTCPVEQVSWLDAVTYANAMSRSQGLPECYTDRGEVVGGGSVIDCGGYRLPTEAEWEYAARGGSSDGLEGSLDQVAWYSRTSGSTTHAVGQLQANAHGLFDMLGNVAEWTHDTYGALGGTETDFQSIPLSSYRFLRGGAWAFDGDRARVAYRNALQPAYRNSWLGFRLARSAR